MISISIQIQMETEHHRRRRRHGNIVLINNGYKISQLFGIGKAIFSRLIYSKSHREDIHPKPTLHSPPIPPCENIFKNIIERSHSSALTDDEARDPHMSGNEKTIRTVYAQKLMEQPTGEDMKSGLYGAMREEVRHGLKEFKMEIEEAMLKSNKTSFPTGGDLVLSRNSNVLGPDGVVLPWLQWETSIDNAPLSTEKIVNNGYGRKNLLVAWWNKISQLFGIGKAILSRLIYPKSRREDIHPKPTLLSPPIPPCENIFKNIIERSHSSALTDDEARDPRMSGNEKTIRAVYAQKLMEQPIGEDMKSGLYEAMREEVRHGLKEFKMEIEESEERKQDLLVEIMMEEQRGRELSKISKDLLLEPSTAVLAKPMRTQRSSDRSRMSKRLTEEAEKYIEDFISNVEDTIISSLDGERSDTSSTLGGPPKLDAFQSPLMSRLVPLEMDWPDGVVLPRKTLSLQ